jgi:hypothetical protein
VTVLSAQWQTRKLSARKSASVLVVTFSGALNANSASFVGSYHLLSAGRNRRLTKPVALTSAVYDPGKNSVSLTPKGAKIPRGSVELQITAQRIVDIVGRPVSGNAGGNYVSVLSRGVSAAAVDALSSRGELP